LLRLSKRRLEEGAWLSVDMRTWFLRASGIGGRSAKAERTRLSKQHNGFGYKETCSPSRDFSRCRGTGFDSD